VLSSSFPGEKKHPIWGDRSEEGGKKILNNLKMEEIKPFGAKKKA